MEQSCLMEVVVLEMILTYQLAQKAIWSLAEIFLQLHL